MSRVPRILPIAAVAIVGVLAVNALSGARDLPTLLTGARAFAEEAAAKTGKAVKGAKPAAKADKAADPSAKPAEPIKLAVASPLPPPVASAIPGRGGALECTPTDASIGREAGLSPAQLQLLQSLQARRGQLDDREKSMEMQLQLINAAQAKLDGRVSALTTLKADIQALLGQADQKAKEDTARMVKVYSTMAQTKPKEAAKQLTILADSVRLPILSSPEMSTRNLATILANMAPGDAKVLNEALAKRLDAQRIDAGRQALAPPAPTPAAPVAASAKAAAATKPAATPPAKTAAAAPAPAAVAPPPTAAQPVPTKLAEAAPPKPKIRLKPKAAAKSTAPDAAAPLAVTPPVVAPPAAAAPATAPAAAAPAAVDKAATG